MQELLASPARLRDVDYRQLTLNDNLNVRVG